MTARLLQAAPQSGPVFNIFRLGRYWHWSLHRADGKLITSGKERWPTENEAKRVVQAIKRAADAPVETVGG